MKENDNIETKKLAPIFEEFLEEINMPFEGYSDEIEKGPWQSYDGFLAHSDNCGNMERLTITTIRDLIGSGEHMGLSIHKKIDEEYKQSWEEIKKDNPELNEENEDEKEQLYNMVDDYNMDEYCGIGYRVRIFYRGNNEVEIFAGYDFDAPYYRWRNEVMFEKRIKFKNNTELKRKLKSLVKKIEAKQ